MVQLQHVVYNICLELGHKFMYSPSLVYLYAFMTY